MSALLELSDLPILDPIREAERLESLHSLDLLDTPPEDRFDRVTRLAAEFFQVPISYVALVDGNRQWFKSRHGLCQVETNRNVSFCQYTIHRTEPLVIPDTLLHPLGRNHPLVIGDPYARFYAGVPLSGPRGQKIGTFCLIDIRPREFSEEHIAKLTSFAAIIEREINLGEVIQTQNELLNTRQQLVESQERLKNEFSEAAKYVQLMLPPVLSGREIIDWQFHPSTELGGDGFGYRRINDDQLAFYILDVAGHGLGSALLAVTALELLRNPAAQMDFSRPSLVIDRLNRTFQIKDHAGKFFSAWYGVYSHSARTLTYSNAGHPLPLILTDKHNSPKIIRTKPGGPVLGIFPEISAPEITIDFPAASELYLFTDGLYELTGPAAGRGSYDEFLVYLESQTFGSRSIWDAMLSWLQRAREEQAIDDDITLLRFATSS